MLSGQQAYLYYNLDLYFKTVSFVFVLIEF